MHLAHIDHLKRRRVELSRRDERAADALDEQVRAALSYDYALLDQLVLRPDHIVRPVRDRALDGELSVELVETRLQRRDGRRLLLDRTLQFGDSLLVDRHGILELAVFGHEPPFAL